MIFGPHRSFLGGLLLVFLIAGCTTRTESPHRATSRPYKIKGRWYYPQKHYELTQTGIASYYGLNDGCHGELTASGERFCMYQMTAAHKTLPLPCIARVTNLENGKQVIVRVNDRGPFKKARVLDVSVAAAKKLGFYRRGLARVRVETLVLSSVSLPKNKAKLYRKPAYRTFYAKNPPKKTTKSSKRSSAGSAKKPRRIEDLLRF